MLLDGLEPSKSATKIQKEVFSEFFEVVRVNPIQYLHVIAQQLEGTIPFQLNSTPGHIREEEAKVNVEHLTASVQ